MITVAVKPAHSIPTLTPLKFGNYETEVSPEADKLRCLDRIQSPLKATSGEWMRSILAAIGATLAVRGAPHGLYMWSDRRVVRSGANSVLKRCHTSLRRPAQSVRFAQAITLS